MVSVFMILLWGGGKRHPRVLQAFSIKVWGVPPHSSLKTSVLKVLLSTSPLSGGLSRGIGEGAGEPTSLAVKAGGPEHARATAMAPRGPKKGRAGQGQGENDLAEEERKKEVKGCTAPQGYTETR